MNIEQLKAMSDTELNELAAIKVMRWIELAGRYYKEKFHYTETGEYIRNVADWNPTTDMNDAMMLVDALGDDYNFELNRKPCGQEHLLYEAILSNDNVYKSLGSSAPRAITIASILAKE